MAAKVDISPLQLSGTYIYGMNGAAAHFFACTPVINPRRCYESSLCMWSYPLQSALHFDACIHFPRLRSTIPGMPTLMDDDPTRVLKSIY